LGWARIRDILFECVRLSELRDAYVEMICSFARRRDPSLRSELALSTAKG
jgi:hypothetical protein